MRQEATPQPVHSPGPAPTVTEEPNPGRTTVDVYRVREVARGGYPVQLSVETVSTRTPYDPRQALEALFGLPPLAKADSPAMVSPENVVAGTSETADALVLDMTSVDETSRPGSAALAEVWVQSWVRTLQSAYNSDKPVLITVGGAPARLFGSVDTTRPIRESDVPVTQDQRIYIPRPSQQVTSPVQLTAVLPEGDFFWRITRDGGGSFEPVTIGVSAIGGWRLMPADLPPGRYHALLADEPGSGTRPFRQTVAFEVVAATTGPDRPVVKDPPTVALETVAVYWATRSNGTLVREYRTRRDPGAVLTGYFRLPSSGEGRDRSGLDPRTRVRAVTRTQDGSVVDFSTLPTARSGLSQPARARQATAFARTVQSLMGDSRPVRVTLDGRPSTFLGQPVLDRPASSRVQDDEGPFPQPADDPGRAEIVGRLADPTSAGTYSIQDEVSQEVLVRGALPAADPTTGVYAFSLAVPAGRYELEVATRDRKGVGNLTVVDLIVA